MKKDFTRKLLKISDGIEKYVKKNATSILAGTGICCFIASTISAVKATPKAVELLEEKKEELNSEELTIKETVSTVGTLYIPSAIMGISGFCFVTASVGNGTNRYLALSTSYKLLEEASRTYKEKVVETIGVRKEKQIRDSIAQDKVDNNPPKEQYIIMTDKGNTLFLDSLTGQYFRSDINDVKSKINDLREQLYTSHDNYARVDEWIMDLGEGQLTVPLSLSNHGWSAINQGKAVNVELRAVKASKYNDEPCLMLEYDPMPVDDSYYYYR